MRYKVADHEVKLWCEHHQCYPTWFELDCCDEDEASGPLDPLHWGCPELYKQLIAMNSRQDEIDRQALVPMGPDYPTGAKKRVPMEEWPQELIALWDEIENMKERAETACRESWAIEIVPVTWSATTEQP